MSGAGSYQSRLEGRSDASGRRFLVVAARFNGHVVDHMVDSARRCLLEHGAEDAGVEVVRVPGAWELPQAVRVAAGTGRFDAILALGCIIRGETPHFEFISAEAARGLGAAARESSVPVVFGVLTTDTEAQALERADPEGQD
ncbi:MAG TPA: 6,7-dimethyl-8-ribityllumazine synthase, partial [Longimicrobiales bacterium]|nr:6,7-dimethyl-8-ribityllumazine synthase [Longimicrobiales bacterium]